MNREERIKVLEEKIAVLEPELSFETKYAARKAAEHTAAKDQLKFVKDTIKEYKEKIKDLKQEIIEEMKKNTPKTPVEKESEVPASV